MHSTTLYRYLLSTLCVIAVTLPTSSLAQEGAEIKAVASELAPQSEVADMLGTLKARGEFTVLLDALRKTGVDQMLAKAGPFTLFAPSDKAFAKLPEGTLDGLSIDELAAVLNHHLVVKKVTAEKALSLGSAVTSGGETIKIKKTDENGLMVDNATVIEGDIMASNGVVHIIDTVLGLSTQDTLGEAADPDNSEKTSGASGGY